MLTCDVVSLYEVKGFLGEIVRKQTSVETLFKQKYKAFRQGTLRNQLA